MAKSKTSQAAALLVKKRWDKTTPEQRGEVVRRLNEARRQKAEERALASLSERRVS